MSKEPGERPNRTNTKPHHREVIEDKQQTIIALDIGYGQGGDTQRYDDIGRTLRTKRQRLTVIDPEGEQVSDMVAFALDDHEEALSSGRTLDYASRLFLTTGDPLYSNRSRVMLQIERDDVGRHDFLLTPC